MSRLPALWRSRSKRWRNAWGKLLLSCVSAWRPGCRGGRGKRGGKPPYRVSPGSRVFPFGPIVRSTTARGHLWRDTMKNPLRILFATGGAVLMVACATDNSTSPLASSQAAAALITAPLSFGVTNSSFVGNSAPTNGFVPMGFSVNENDGNNNEHEGPGWGGFMGGGLGEGFIGGIGFGPGIGRGPFGDWDDSDACAFSTTTNRVECSMTN